MRSKRSTSTWWLAGTSFAACKISALKGSTKRNTDERTARRTPIPAKTAFAKGSSCTPMLQCTSSHYELLPGTYHANTLGKSHRNCVKDVHRWTDPFH